MQFTNNAVSKNGGNGFISIGGYPSSFGSNNAMENTESGIIAPNQSTDLGGNRAHGNADPQCVNITCSP